LFVVPIRQMTTPSFQEGSPAVEACMSPAVLAADWRKRPRPSDDVSYCSPTSRTKSLSATGLQPDLIRAAACEPQLQRRRQTYATCAFLSRTGHSREYLDITDFSREPASQNRLHHSLLRRYHATYGLRPDWARAARSGNSAQGTSTQTQIES